MQGQYNLRSPAVKRLMKEAHELRHPTEQYYAHPLEDNLFEWHFTIRGPEDTDFQTGIYHGRIILPPDYPMKPPSIILLTPNGRFETHKKICLSISGHHPESWQPSWSIRTALLAIIGFMPTHGSGAIGSLDYTSDERKILAKRSLQYKCTDCGDVRSVLKAVTAASDSAKKEAKELATQIAFQGEKEKGSSDKEEKPVTAQPQQHKQPCLSQVPINVQRMYQMMSQPLQGTVPQGYSANFPDYRNPAEEKLKSSPSHTTPGNLSNDQPADSNSENNEEPGNNKIVGQSQTQNSNTSFSVNGESIEMPEQSVNIQNANGSDTVTGQSSLSGEGIRRRNNTAETSDVNGTKDALPEPFNGTAGLSSGRYASGGVCSLVLIVILSLAILMLILRRVYMSNAWSFDFY